MSDSSRAITALISMKGHSSRVPRKNIRTLAGQPCCYWIISELEKARRVKKVVVETDDDEIESVVRAGFPDLTILRRPNSLKGDYVSMNPLIQFHMDNCEDSIFLQTHSTNPLLRAETIDASIKSFFQPGDHDSLFTATELQTRLYWPDGTAVNHNPKEMLPTQELPPILEENSCIYIFSRESFAKFNHRVGENPKIVTTPHLESVDIDEEHDFAFCEYLMRERIASKP